MKLLINGTKIAGTATDDYTGPMEFIEAPENYDPAKEYEYIDGDLVEAVPEEVEGWQAEVAMKATPVDPEDSESQNVWDRVQDLFAAMPDGIEKITAQTVLARGKIRRDSSILAQFAPLVPLSEERVDDLMRLAASIEA